MKTNNVKQASRLNRVIGASAVAVAVVGTQASAALTALDVDLSDPIASIGIALIALVGLGVAIKGAKKVISMFG